MNQQIIDLTAEEAAPPRRSIRHATIIPASHWISIGYSQEDAQLMENLQNDMKKYCDGENKTDIEFIGNYTILPHHDMMLPHWKKFANGLSRRASVTSLRIGGIYLPAPVLDIILPPLQSIQNLTKLTLCNTGLGKDIFLKISSFLENNTSLRSLGLGLDKIDDVSIAASLAGALINHPNIRAISLVDCGLGTASLAKEILGGCTKLNQITITRDSLGPDVVAVLADFISSNHPLKLLSLTDDQITNTETLSLASALKKNTNLKKLDLKENNWITDEGEKALLKAMYDPTSMDSIVDSNHTCKAYAFNSKDRSAIFQRSVVELEILDINRVDFTIGQKIRKKVVLALCGVDGGLFDLSHFNDLPLQLMPRVLELIQEHTKYRSYSSGKQLEQDALSRLFPTLRGWELPLLFVNLDSPSANVASGKKQRRKTRR